MENEHQLFSTISNGIFSAITHVDHQFSFMHITRRLSIYSSYAFAKNKWQKHFSRQLFGVS